MSLTITLQAADGATHNIAIPSPNIISNNTIIPVDRLFAWKPGVTYNNGIPNRTTVYKTLIPLANNADNSTQIQNALNSCPNGQVVLLSSGTFTINTNSPILIPSNVTLRGAGAGVTILNKLNGGVSRSSNVAPYTNGKIYEPTDNAYNITSPYSILSIGKQLYPSANNSTSINLTIDSIAGNNSITVANASGFSVGQYVLIDEMSNASWKPCNIPAHEDNTTANTFMVWGGDRVTYNIHYPYLMYEDDCSGSNATNPFDTSQSPGAPAVIGGYAPYVTVDYSRYDRLINEIKQISSISNNTISFYTPLSISYRTSHKAQITGYTGSGDFVSNSGIESMTLVGGGSGAINFLNTADSWVKNVEIYNWVGVGVDFVGSYRCELRDSYIHTGSWPVPGGAGYAIGFDWASSECLVENNISIDTCKNIVARAAGTGSVVAYNYMDDAWDGAEGVESWQEVSINGSHLAGPHHILFEGNYGFNFDSDYTHGGSSYHTVFRNVLTGKRRDFTDTVSTNGGNLRTVGLSAYSWNFSFVGNILGYNNPDVIHWNYTDSAMSCDINGSNCTGNNNSWGDIGSIWRLGYDPERWDAPPESTTLSTTIRDGNYDYLTNSQRWHNTPNMFTIPNSLYLTSIPNFFGNNVWPYMNPSNGQVITLPALARFNANTPNKTS